MVVQLKIKNNNCYKNNPAPIITGFCWFYVGIQIEDKFFFQYLCLFIFQYLFILFTLSGNPGRIRIILLLKLFMMGNDQGFFNGAGLYPVYNYSALLYYQEGNYP